MNFSARNLLSSALLCATLLSTTTVQAMEVSRTEICKECLPLYDTCAKKYLFNLPDSNGRTALHVACEKGHRACAQLLIQNGAEIDAKDNNAETPLHRACAKNRKACARLLIKHHADVNAKNSAGKTPLDNAGLVESKACITLLLKKGALATNTDGDGSTPLPSPLRETGGDADLFLRCMLLVRHGIYRNPEGDCYQVSPDELRAAAAAVNVKVPAMEKICEKCLRPGQGIREKNWMTDQLPLFRAASKGHIECLKKISWRGVSLHEIDQNGWSTLHHACFNGKLDCVQFLLEAGVTPNGQSTLGVTPLHLCCNIHPECVNALLSNNAKPNIQDNSGETPLHRVCKKWDIRSVWFLLHCKANPNLQNKKGNTPLHHACEFDFNAAVFALLNAGADLTIKNLEDKTPLQVAQEKGHSEVVETIKKFVEKKT